MKLHLYFSLLVGVNIINVTNSITSTPSTTPVITCRGIYFSDVLDVCQQGLFFISPEISATVDDPTPILYSELKTFTIIPGNLSCNYVVQWKTPQGTFDELDGNVEPGINEICAINEIYTACGYIFLISTTTETTKTTTVYTTSLTSTTTIPSTELSTSTSTLTSTDPTTTQALSTTPILSSTELASSVPTPSLSSTVPDSSSTFQPALESSSITSTPSTTSIPSSILSTSSTSSSITPSSSMETSTATLTTFTPSTSADTTTVFSEPTTAEASTATDSTTTMSKTLITSISSSTSLSTPIATSTYTSSVVSSTPSSSMTSFFSTSSFTRSTPTYSSQSTSESATPTSSVMSSSSTPYISTSSSQKEESSTVVPTESTVVSSSSAFSTTITTLTSTQPTSTIVSSSTTMSATPHIETSSSTAATNLNSTSVASTILKSSLATVAISPTEEVMETTPTPVFSTTSVLMTSPSSTSSSTVLSTMNDLDTSDTSLYTTSFSLSTLSSFQSTDSTSDLSTTEKANPTSTLSASSIELSSPTSTSPAHSYSSSDLGSTYHTVTDVTDASEPNLTSASDAPTTTRYIEDLEERKKNELIAEKLEELKSKNETSDDSIDKLLGKNREELIDLIQNEISTNPKMDDESIREYIENITKNMTSANEELAKAIESILGDVDKVDIKSPNVMFDLLENVKGSIAESNGFTIDPTQKTGEQYGTYFSEYGELRGEGFNIVLHGCSVTVQGKDVFLSGRIIPSKIQSANEETYLKYYSEGTVEMVGEFQNWTSVSVNRGSFVSKKLTDSSSVIHFQNTANIQISSNDYNPPMLYGLELWNSSLLRVSGSKQAQNYASLTAFVNIENLQLNLQLTKSLISDLLQGIPQPAISCSFQMTVQDRTYTINTGEGYIMAKSIDETSHTILYIGNSMTVTPEFTELHKLLYFPLNFKNVDVSWFDNTEIGNTTVRLKAANDDILNIDVILPESKLPPVRSRTNPINRTTLIINSPATIDDINVVLKNGGILTVAGAITIENTVIEVGNNSLKVDGKSFTISLGEINTLSLSEVVYELRRTTSPPTLVLLSGRVTATEIPHYRSEFTFDGEDRMYFTGGTLIRNQTNGIILIGSTLQLSKDFSASSFSVIPQSLFTQKSYEYLTNTMSNINDYLSNNSYSLSPEELTKTLDEMLNTTASLIDSLQTTAKSPLPSDVAINLLYEKTNYNDIFNVIPENPDDIRYVEEMTEEEWAAEATEIVQKQMAKDLLEQTKKILTNLVDTIATKKIQNGEIPFLMEFPGAGLEMIIAGGTSEFVLSNTYSCTNWEVGFPKNAEDLNLVGITKDTIIRVDVACYGSNNYYFVDDYNQLINSGSVDVQLKTADSEVMKVKDAKEPIVIMGETLNDNINPSIPLASNPIDENQILDFRSFIVSAWNTSLTIEVQFPTLANGEEKVLFIGYQSQPGPRDEDHEYIFNYNSSIDNNRFFIPSEKLHNMTGMYILGIGTKVSSITNGTVTYDETDKPPEISEPFQFKKDSSEFYARVLTKGCYAYKNETDRMESEGVSVVDSSSTTRVICHSRHLTSFSVGIKNPEIAVKYSYDFTVDIVPKNVRPMILIAAYTIFLLITFYNCCTIERLDKDRGEMRHLKDNHPADEYIYVISVFTGFRQFSSSQSTICFNITGEAASEMGRRLETEEDDVQHVLKWGTCARFLMRTHWPLGNLKYLRLWIEKPGEEQSEAWFCTKVVIYDLQTTKKFTFPVHSWFGRTNGDGQTERLCQVDNSINLFNESISFHNILEQISYIAMFLGGTGISRLRLERDVYILSLWISSSIITTILCFTTHLLNNSKTKDSYKIFDAVVGMILALLLTVINMILPYIAKKSYTRDENERVKYYKQNYTNYVEAKRQWKPLFKTLVTTIVKTTIMILLVLNTVKCFSLSEQYANIFTRRFLVMMFLWLALFEPFKAFLMCLKNIKWNRTYQIISPSELSFLPIKALAEFQKCPEEIVDKSTGSSYADLSKLRASKDNRMRDEMLFHTVREIIFLVFSLIIFVSLTYLLRDRFGYYYHHQIKNNYNLETKESSFSNIKSIDDFWKWSDSSLVNGLMASWPDGEPAYDMRGFVNDKASRTMGTGIIRQIRSIPHKCDFVLPEASSQSVCVNDIWNAGYEMTSHFDASWLPYTNSTDIEYTYRSSELLQSNSIMGQLGTYKGGGYVVSLQGTADALRTKFQKLRNESWIDKETRAVVVELSLYNAQINYFGVLQLLLEIPRAKFCLPTVWVESMRLIREDEDTINGTIECLYICYCVIKFTLEFFYIIHDRFKLLGKHLIFSPIQLLRWLMIGGYDLWQTMDFFVGLVSMISIITYIMKVVYVKEAVDSFLNTNGNSYINLSKQRDTDLMFTYTFATVVFFVSCKLMKILRFNHRIGVLADTLESATTGITDYGQGFLCVLNAFILAMMHLLGNSLEGYYSYIVSLQTLVSSLLGKLGGGKVYDLSTLGSTYFLLFMFLGTVLLLNVFVMIIMYEFEIVRTNADRLANNYEIIEHISYKVKNTCGMLERSNKVSVALQDQYCEAPFLQIFKRKIYLAIYRMSRLHNMNRLNRTITREARIESVPDDIKNATVL